MKNIVIAILFACNIVLAVLCHNWSQAYESLYADYEKASDPNSRRADIRVLTNGDVWVLFDGRWLYRFQGACSHLPYMRAI